MPLLAVLLLLAMQPDSAGLDAHARRAQLDFERDRLWLMRTGGPGGRQCDARIGRFCYWSDPSDTVLPVEPSDVRMRRRRLLATLDTVSRALPGDGWVAGQRVRYLVEAGRPDDAADAAQACRAAAWWCAALQGLVQQVAQDFQDAATSFDRALAEMPPEERCRWTDLSVLLEGAMQRGYRALSCAVREDVDARLWWLAQPMWWMPGNDRRTEHYARVTMARLLEDSSSPYGPWGDDERELILRYGWPLAWVREDRGDSRFAVGFEAEPGWHFLPDLSALDAAASADAPAALDERGAVERYAPAYARHFTILHPDFAAFRRPDSTLVVASWDVSGDKAFRSATYASALALAHDERSPPVVVSGASSGAIGSLVAEAPWAPAVLSLELYDPNSRTAARDRVPLAPSAAFALSGILFFEPADSLPADLPEALARLHTGAVPAGQRIGVYWEVYGLAPGEDAPTAVTVTPEQRGLLTRIAAALGLASRSGAVRLEWHGAAPSEAVSRALVVDLGGLGAGRYRVDVTVSPPARAPATTSGAMRVVRP
jgi:hypothetical protein